ncbi:MAG TPA: hypothetical protein VFR41_04945 [Acidimicrobiia bacterium]|nr:hypothetical protein [Acidimicrobiia bacterium]
MRKLLATMALAGAALGLSAPAHATTFFRVAHFVSDPNNNIHTANRGFAALGWGNHQGWHGYVELMPGALPRGKYVATIHMSDGAHDVNAQLCTFTVNSRKLATACRGRLTGGLLGPNVWPQTHDVIVTTAGGAPVMQATLH